MSAQLFETMPELNLSVPDNWASIDCVELNEALLYEWLRSLPENDISAYLSEYLASLSRFHLNQIEPHQRLVLLDIYRKPLLKLIHGFDADKLLKNTADSEQLNITVQTMTDLLCSLAMGYKIVVLETLKKEQSLKHNQLTLMAINRVSEQLSYIALFAYKFYQSIPKRVFSELHQLYCLCLVQGVEDKVPKIAGPVKTDRSIKSFYSQLMLMSICNPYGLARGKLVDAFQIMQQLSSAIDISPMKEGEAALAGHFYINCLSDKPPTPSLLRKTKEQRHPPTLVLDTKPALVKVDLLFQRSHMTDVSSKAVDIDLVKQIAPFLNTSYERKQFRTELENKQRVILAIGLHAVYQSVAAINASFEIDAKSLGNEWQVLNKNSSGYLVTRDKEVKKHQIRVGDLIGVFEPVAENKLQLARVGFIRWLKTSHTDTTKMGITLIEGQPVSVEYQLDKSLSFAQGLFFPEASHINQAASLITDNNVFCRNEKIIIKPKKKKFQFEMMTSSLLDTGKNFEHFSLRDDLGRV